MAKNSKVIDEDSVNEMIKIIRGVKQDARDNLMVALESKLTSSITGQTVERIRALANQGDAEIREWLKEHIPKSYLSGFNAVSDTLNEEQISLEQLLNDDNLESHRRSVNALIASANFDFGQSMTGMVKSAKQTLNGALRRQVRAQLAIGQLAGSSIDDIAEDVANTIGEQGFSVLVDRGGRSWDLENYSRMLSRTHLARANVEGSINRTAQIGVDLVEIIESNPPDALCQSFHGRVFSISGESENYPVLSNRPPFHPNSYSDDTEVYTMEDGWRLVKDVEVGERVISLDPDSLDLRYVKVDKTHEHESEKMIHFKNKIADMMVTPDHNMFYQTDWDSKKNRERWQFKKAKDLLGKKSGRFYASSEWSGNFDFDLLFAKFMGIWLAEGSVNKRGENQYTIRISQSREKNEENYLEMLQITREAFPDVVISEYDAGFEFNDTELGQHLTQFGKAKDKFVPWGIKQANREVIRAFLDSFRMGDGSERKTEYKGKEGNFRNEMTYHTSSKRLADEIGELILKLGRRPSYYLHKVKGKKQEFRNGEYEINENVWTVRECYHRHISLQNMEIKEVDYGRKAYCLTLEDYHTLLTRRNGKVVWSGNCVGDIAPRPDLE